MEGQELDRDSEVLAETGRSEVRQGERRAEAHAEKEGYWDRTGRLFEAMLSPTAGLDILTGKTKLEEDSSSSSSGPPPEEPYKDGPQAAHPENEEPVSPQSRAYQEQLRRQNSQEDAGEEEKLIAMAKPKLSAASAALNRSLPQPVPRPIKG